MSCFCIPSHDFDDECGFDEDSFKSVEVDSQDPYECIECGEKGTGEREVVTATVNGAPWTCSVCPDCEAVARVIACDGRAYGSLWSDVEGAIDDGMELTTQCLSKIRSARGREMLIDYWKQMTEGGAR